jgi:hypothetical protein
LTFISFICIIIYHALVGVPVLLFEFNDGTKDSQKKMACGWMTTKWERVEGSNESIFVPFSCVVSHCLPLNAGGTGAKLHRINLSSVKYTQCLHIICMLSSITDWMHQIIVELWSVEHVQDAFLIIVSDSMREHVSVYNTQRTHK